MTSDEVWELWQRLPVARLRFELRQTLQAPQLRELARDMQGRFWSQLCGQAQAGGRRCADAPLAVRRCVENCSADRYFPLDKNGSGNFRMARVFVRGKPGTTSLDVLVLGALDERVEATVYDCLVHRHGVAEKLSTQHSNIARLHPRRSGLLTLHTSTPLNLGPIRRGQSAAELQSMLRTGLAARGYKLTALALGTAAEPLPAAQSSAQCLAAKRTGLVVLGRALHVEDDQLESIAWRETSVSSGTAATYALKQGRLQLRLDAQAWPWVAAMLLCGAGESADEGWGSLTLEDAATPQ